MEKIDIKIMARCTRCKNRHAYAERVPVPVPDSVGRVLVCPRCLCRSYNDITEYDFVYRTGYPAVGRCKRAHECQLVANLKRDDPLTDRKLVVKHYSLKELRGCKYFKKREQP